MAFCLLVFFVFKMLGFSSVNFYIYSVAYLIIASVVVLINNYILLLRWLDSLSFYVSSLFVLATLVYIYEWKLEKKITLVKRKRVYSCFSLFLMASFLFTSIFLNLTDIKVYFFNNFYKEKYFNEIDMIEVNGEDIYNEMDFLVETPGDYNIINGIFTIEGWAIDESEIPGTKIDYVGIYFDNKPQDGGEFVSRCKYGIKREDISEAKGEKFKNSGFLYRMDSNKIEDGLRKFYIYFHSNNFEWKYDTLELLINNKDSFVFEDILDKKNKDIEFKYSNISEDGNIIVMEEGENVVKYIKFPVNIESGQDYWIGFRIKEITNLDNYIHFDFYGDGYDNPEQEFSVEHTHIDKIHKEIRQLINVGNVSPNANVFFRIYTYSKGSVEITNLKIYKVSRKF